MKISFPFLTIIISVAIWTTPNLHADMYFTADKDFDIGSDSYRKGDIVEYESTPSSTLFFDRDLVTGGNDVLTAVHRHGLSGLIFTTQGNFEIGADSFDRGDLVLYDLNTDTATKFFDRDLITNGNRNVTAATLLTNGNLIFTTENDFEVGTALFEAGDLALYDFATGTASLYFDRDLITDGDQEIQSTHVLANGNILFTTAGESTIGSDSYQEGDVILYDFTSGSSSLYLDRDVITDGGQSIIAFSLAVPEPSGALIGCFALGLVGLRRQRSVKQVQ